MLARPLTGILICLVALQACADEGPDRGPKRSVANKGGGGAGDSQDGQDANGVTPEGSPPMAAPGMTYCKGATPLVAFIGGSSIALRWSTLPGAPDGAKEYRVYRNGSNVGTVKPEFHPDFPEKNGKGFIDKDIVAGASYEYRVEAVDEKDAATDVGAPVCVVAPKELAPPPAIELDYSQGTDLEFVMRTAKTFLEIWYPKVAYALALPDYSPMASFRLRLDPACKCISTSSSDAKEIVVDPVDLRKATQDMGMFLHEATRLLHSAAKDTPPWVASGIADWTREYMLHDRDPVAIEPYQHYTQGYSQGAFFLNWIRTRIGSQCSTS